jgi:hypothetical protein
MNRFTGHHYSNRGTLAFATNSTAALVFLREAPVAFEIQKAVTPRAISHRCSFMNVSFAQMGTLPLSYRSWWRGELAGILLGFHLCITSTSLQGF